MTFVKDLPEGFILSVRAKDGGGSSFVVPTTAWALMALGFGDKGIERNGGGSTIVDVSLQEWDKICEVPF